MQTEQAIPKSNNDAREFDFTKSDFERVCKLIYDHAGISLSPSKQEMVYSRLARRLRATGLDSFKDYLALLEGSDTNEWEAFTNSLTTNLTSFFREEHHFPVLAEHVRRFKGEQITLWCCAASTGEEPYSMAITLAETFGTIKPPVKILATDVDTNVLATARAGVYSMDRVDKMKEERMRRFFQRGTGANAGTVRVREELRSLVTFRQLNLLDAKWPVSGPFHGIFCRNVMIYFDKQTQYSILKKFAPLLRPDGIMFAGHSESFHHALDLFHLRGKTVYELARSARAVKA